ncbi:Transcription factor, Myb superfamily [Handroanthus impetiginosus]|uniref:Transcription factor, Myb superfamily n=1 Tax=Handroanthus impetiginosus TaxID=429701 RepID=A0A2G9G3Z2_9LAMI|nr:Transcription factor, Myb superfamily [Handroanthus impetiginosus]PIN07028.1 Transcription factor, Myb superfamily [Handroanthus impetiginosus]
MGRQPCCDKIGLKRGPWTIEEDHKLMSFIMNNGIQCWRMVPKLAGRTDNEIKNHWNTRIKKRLKLSGLDPLTHQPIVQKEKAKSDFKQNEEEKVEINAQILQEEPKADHQIMNEAKADIITRSSDNLINYEMMYRSTYSPSIISLEDSVSFHNSMGESIYEESSNMQQWVESVDSFLYWDGINEVDQNFVF